MELDGLAASIWIMVSSLAPQSGLSVIVNMYYFFDFGNG